MNPLYGNWLLTPGVTSVTVTFSGGSGKPVGGMGSIMAKGSSTSIQATLDHKTLTPTSATFYFTSAIPNDGNEYKLFFFIGLPL